MKYNKETVITHQRKDGTIYHSHRVTGIGVTQKGLYRLQSCEDLYCPKCAFMSRICDHFSVTVDSKGRRRHVIAWNSMPPKKLGDRQSLRLAYLIVSMNEAGSLVCNSMN